MGFWDFLPYVGEERGWWEDRLNEVPTIVNPAVPGWAKFGSLKDFFGIGGDSTKAKGSKSSPYSPMIPGGFGVSGQSYAPPSWADLQKDINAGVIAAPIPGIPTEYLNMLNAATQAQMAPIEAAFSAGTNEVARREGTAKKLMKIFPGQIKETGKEQRNALLDLSKTFGGMVNAAAPVDLAKIGMAPTLGMEPGLAGMAAITQGRLQDVPYLQAAGNQFFGGQRTALDLARQAAAGEIAAQQQQNLTQIALAQMEAQNQASMFNAEQQNRARMSLAELSNQWGIANIRDQGDNPLGSMMFGGAAVSPERGFQLMMTDPGRIETITSQFPERMDEARSIITDSMKMGPEAVSQALNEWVFEATSDGARRVRAELASLLMANMGSYSG